MTNTDIVQRLADALRVREQPAPDISEHLHLCGEWHYVGSSAATLPAGGSGPGSSGQVVSFGSEFTVTPAMLENSLDRFGRSEFIEMLSSEDVQIERRQEVSYRSGPWPQNALRVRQGSVEFLELARAERQRAARIVDADERAAELHRLRGVFGNALVAPTSTTIGEFDGGSGRGSSSPFSRRD